MGSLCRTFREEPLARPVSWRKRSPRNIGLSPLYEGSRDPVLAHTRSGGVLVWRMIRRFDLAGALTAAVGACRAPVSDSRAPGSNLSGACQLGTQANAGHRWQPSRRPLSPPGPCACNTAWFFAVPFQPSAADSIGIVNIPLTPTMYIQYRYTIPNTPLTLHLLLKLGTTLKKHFVNPLPQVHQCFNSNKPRSAVAL